METRRIRILRSGKQNNGTTISRQAVMRLAQTKKSFTIPLTQIEDGKSYVCGMVTSFKVEKADNGELELWGTVYTLGNMFPENEFHYSFEVINRKKDIIKKCNLREVYVTQGEIHEQRIISMDA